ncbi:MAG: homocysteine S-methyltransferase [Planctomycetota bacterium]|nr:homocysteine S-methyltransferase [Planctomycetota bacterium]
MSADPIQRLLGRQKLLILDGGLATELEAQGHDLSDALWSARLLRDDPGAIRDVHKAYLEAGADIIVTSSYQATIEALGEPCLSLSTQLAIEARAAVSPHALVAASVGPYGAARADGSEYTGAYDLDEHGLVEFHARRFEILAQSGADLLACETIPSYAEARALAHLLNETPDIWAWFSFSCRDERLISDGTPLAECVAFLRGRDRIAAVGINCTAPEFVRNLIGEVRRSSDTPVVVYPNSGEKYDAGAGRWTGQAADLTRAAVSWKEAGATLIGGCCRTNPEHIRQLRRELLPADSV